MSAARDCDAPRKVARAVGPHAVVPAAASAVPRDAEPRALERGQCTNVAHGACVAVRSETSAYAHRGRGSRRLGTSTTLATRLGARVLTNYTLRHAHDDDAGGCSIFKGAGRILDWDDGLDTRADGAALRGGLDGLECSARFDARVDADPLVPEPLAVLAEEGAAQAAQVRAVCRDRQLLVVAIARDKLALVRQDAAARVVDVAAALGVDDEVEAGLVQQVDGPQGIAGDDLDCAVRLADADAVRRGRRYVCNHDEAEARRLLQREQADAVVSVEDEHTRAARQHRAVVLHDLVHHDAGRGQRGNLLVAEAVFRREGDVLLVDAHEFGERAAPAKVLQAKHNVAHAQLLDVVAAVDHATAEAAARHKRRMGLVLHPVAHQRTVDAVDRDGNHLDEHLRRVDLARRRGVRRQHDRRLAARRAGLRRDGVNTRRTTPERVAAPRARRATIARREVDREHRRAAALRFVRRTPRAAARARRRRRHRRGRRCGRRRRAGRQRRRRGIAQVVDAEELVRRCAKRRLLHRRGRRRAQHRRTCCERRLTRVERRAMRPERRHRADGVVCDAPLRRRLCLDRRGEAPHAGRRRLVPSVGHASAR